MDGDLAPLPEIAALAEKYGALTLVDDAHGEGVLGSHGRGIVDHFKLHGKIDIEVGTLSKAFGVVGGFITGRKELIDFYRQKARQFLFSNGLSVPDTAALIESVKMLESSDTLVKKLWSNAKYLSAGLTKVEFDIGRSETPITPVMLGDENRAKLFSEKLFARGVFATAIKFPMVARGAARIRAGAPPLIPEGADAPTIAANALPQALVLTAIVIGFGLFAFAIVLVFRAWTTLNSLTPDDMRLAEPEEAPK